MIEYRYGMKREILALKDCIKKKSGTKSPKLSQENLEQEVNGGVRKLSLLAEKIHKHMNLEKQKVTTHTDIKINFVDLQVTIYTGIKVNKELDSNIYQKGERMRL